MKLVSFTDNAGSSVRAFTSRATYTKIRRLQSCPQAAEVHGIYLLAAILCNVALAVETVMLVRELFACQNHGDTDSSQQACKCPLHPPFDIVDARSAEEIE